MVQTPITTTYPRNVRETINWLIRLGRPPLPECPIEAAKQGKEPKAPCFLDNRNFLKSVSWKQWQNNQPIKEIYEAWFANPRTGIGTLGGWNGKHWLGWIDFDQKDFASGEECDRIIAEWLEKHPLMKDAPTFRTPSGGYRFLVAFNQEPQNFKANSGFSLKPDGSHHVGELLSKNGGHTLLPPTVGVTGKAYEWGHWTEYPPVVNQPEDIGLYPVHQKTASVQAPQQGRDNLTNNSLADLLNNQINPRFTLERAFNWQGHDFKQSGSKLKGNCPWHNSSSGTAFYAEFKDGTPVWRCPACETGGSVIEYRHRLAGGNGSPRGRDFVELVKGLADEVGVTVPELSRKPNNNNRRDEGNRNNRASEKIINHPNFTPLNSDELQQKIDDLISKKLTGSKLTAHLNPLAVEAQWHITELKKLYFERKREIEQTEEQAEAQSLLPSLLQVNRLNLREFLWGDDGLLAEAILETAKAMPTSPEFLFTTLIPTAATLIGTSSRIVVKAKGKYKQPCIFWSAVVARSGQLKTPAQKVILDPLVSLEIKASEQYQSELEQYEIDLTNWKKDKDADPADKPKPPVRKRYLTKDATIESLERIHGQNPRGILVHRDELAEDFKSDNAHRQGKGGDKEKKLDQFNGSPLIIDRKEREIVLERSAVSRTGSIQWEVLQSLMGDGRDDNGTFARWLFCAAESPPRFINLLEDDHDTGIEELLMHLYKRLEKMPEGRDYLLTTEAKQLFQNWQHELVKAEIAETHPALQLVYPKIEAYTARFALWLHVVNSALAEVTPPAVIGDRTMSAAIKLAKYYLEQSKLVMLTNTPQSGLTGVLLKIQKYAQGKPDGVKVYKLKSAIKDLRKTPSEVLLSHCQWLAEHGYGALSNNVYRVDQLLPKRSTRSTPDSTVVLANPNSDLLTNCCPVVNTVNTSNSGSSSQFVDFVDQNDTTTGDISVTELNNLPSVNLCNEKSQDTVEAVNTINTVNKPGETYIESCVDRDQQLVNNGQQSQQPTIASADDAITSGTVESAMVASRTAEGIASSQTAGVASTTAPTEDDEAQERIEFLANILPAIAENWLLEELDQLRVDVSRAELNAGAKRLSPELRTRIKHMVLAHPNARIQYNQYFGYIAAKSKDGEFFITWDAHTQKQAQKCGDKLPGTLKVWEFTVIEA
ncbi:MAG TPA: DUF3987 domain-containing protein [Coleofasciculaceae cyanobacterium]